MTQQPTTPSGGQPTLGELVARISENVSGLIQGEIDLAKAKAKVMGTQMGLGAGLLAAAGVLALYALGFLLDAGAHGIAAAFEQPEAWLWLGKLVVALVLLVVVAVLALVGTQRLKAGKASVPDPKAGLQAGVDAVRSSLTSGLQKGGTK